MDLYQIHRFDYQTPIEETIEALHDVVKAGKALYVGGSSMFAWQFANMLYKADELRLTRFVSMQNHYNLIYREEEREMIPLCRAEGIAVIPWSPLARGFLAGNRKQEGFRRHDSRQDRRLRAENVLSAVGLHGGRATDARSPASAVYRMRRWRWPGCSQQPGVTAPIIGASKMQHLDDAVAALQLKLDEAELKALSEPYRPHPVLGHS